MKNNLERTFIALAISLTGVLLSYYFLYPDDGQKQSGIRLIEMAKVISTKNDVKKQAANKIIWVPVRIGDILYLGEKLRTSSLSSSKIEFIENGALIDIEPDSLIVVNKNNQKLSLQVIEGSLIVSSKKEVANLSITSGDKAENNMNIKNGDFSYSVSQEGKANVEVLKGEVDVKSPLIVHSSQNFKDLEPAYDQNLFIDIKNNEDSFYKWAPLSAEYTVKLEVGSARNNLQIIDNAIVENDKGLIKTKAIAGTYYWKLTAQNKNNPVDSFSSSTFKVNYKQKIAPLALYPIANEMVQLNTTNSNLEFKWSLMHNFESIQLEIFNEENLTKPLLNEQVTSQTFFSTNKINRAGKYSWKLVGKVSGSEEPLVSLQQKFQIFVGFELLSPVLLYPEDKSTIYNSDKGLKNFNLSWKAVKDASEYLITIKNKTGELSEHKASINEFAISNFPNDSYTWSVQSINQKKEISKKGSFYTFTLKKMKQLYFKNKENKINFTNQFPTYNFLWNTIPHTFNYRLKLSQAPGMSPHEIISVKEDHFKYQIGKEGMYYVQLEALTKEEDVIAQSEVFSFSVTKSPPPPAPFFLNNKNSLEANSDGDISFELTNFDKKYNALFEIRDSRGLLIEQSKSNSANATFKSLSPGTYFVTAKFRDELNQEGELSTRNYFLVPNNSSIAAPKPKGIKVR